MINASKTEKTLVLFINHTNFLLGLREDVIARESIPPARQRVTTASTRGSLRGGR
jgi:hypothetical protein